MGVPTGRIQFFILEATDYLERLAVVYSRAELPDPDELIRLTRALRGAALMAGFPSYAQAAAGLEHMAKLLRDDPEAWPSRAAGGAAAVTTLRELTGRAAEWTDRDAAAAADLARSLAGGGDPPETGRARFEGRSSGDELTSSVRAFIGREGSLIGGTLEHAAQALELGQPEAAAQAVLPRLQPLRGLAALPSLSPLPEFLDAIELTVRALRADAPPPDGPAALRRAAAAVTHLSREVADQGQVGADAPVVLLGAVSLLESFGTEDDVLPIETLCPQGVANQIVRRGEVADPEAGPDPMIELVSLADRFRQAGEQLPASGSSTGRTLYLYGLLVQLRPLAKAAPRERPYLAELLEAVGGAIGSGRANRAPDRFATLLREAADLLAESGASRNAVFLGDELGPVVAAIRSFDGPAAPEAAPAPAVAVEADDDVVPIAELAPEPEPEPEAVDIASLAPDPAPTPVDDLFARSFSTYHALTTPPAPPAAPEEDATADVVPIESLLFSGRRALERADLVRRDLSLALERGRSIDDLRPLVSELIDLVPLALAE